MKFTLPGFDDPDELLEAAARLTLRLALRCDWVEGCTDKDDRDPDSWNGLYERIQDLMGAYCHSREGRGEKPNYLLSRFAGCVANQLARVPSLRMAIAEDLASKQDNDP
jgi:hypothetical protein